MIEKGAIIGGRYRLVREIGQGGMATVWEAEHLTLGSPVAVKFLYTSGPTADEMVGRFMREARVAASVRHRNVIEITDFGLADDDKTPYMVMELLEGESLADRLDRQRVVDPRFATQIIWLALRGLAAVHDAGIVHRDLKPENIFLVTDSDGTYPKLLDFGVSRETADDANITREGILIGTPAYMSPEQARGLRDLDLRTDLYSMGVIFYELVAGQLPFESENPGDLIVMITRDEPPRLQTLQDALPDGVYEWVERAMAKDREERFHDAREMRWALAEACKEFGFGLERDTGVSRVSEFPNTGQFQRPKPDMGGFDLGMDDVPASRPGAPGPSKVDGAAATERLSLEELAAMQSRTPVGTPESSRPPPSSKGTRGRGILVIGLSAAMIIGVAAALLIPQSPFAPASLSAPEEPEGTAWEPMNDSFPESLLPPPEEPEPGVHLKLYGLPPGAVARVEGIVVDEALAFVPQTLDSYRVEVFDGEERVWAVEHPGNVDGEYEVWRMSESEIAETVADEAGEGRQAGARANMRRGVRPRMGMRGPRRAMRRR